MELFFKSFIAFFDNFQHKIRNFLQINPRERPEIDDILEILEATAALISNNPQFECDWKSFHSLIRVPAEFNVDERTQCSRDLFKEVTKITLKAKSGQIITGGSKLHDQKDTNLCAYFATMSALRHQLRRTVGKNKSGTDTWPHKYAGLEIEVYLKRRDEDEKRFERDLAVMIGCVCPRALSARFKIRQHLFFLFYNSEFFISKE